MNVIEYKKRLTAIDDFVHLHLHTTYSFLDGANKISECIKRLKELGMTTCAITDHNHIGGTIEFQEECKANGIKPILGCEMYQTWDTNTLSLPATERKEIAMQKAREAGVEIPEKINGKKITQKQINEIIEPYQYDVKQYHLVVLAMNQKGWENLVKLQSESSNKCTYNGRYCCDFELLEKYNEGLIILSACLGGMIPNSIIKGEYERAEELVLRYKEIFGDRFYLEIQPLFNDEQAEANTEIIRLARKHNIQLVATNDVHYTRKEDKDDHDTLLCVGIGKKKSDEDRMHYEHEFWIRSRKEMVEAFARHEIDEDIVTEALNNTVLIANRIEDIKLGSDVPLFPEVKVPKGLTPEQYLTQKSYKELYKYLSRNPNLNIVTYEKRLAEELEIINVKGYAPYILKIIENVEFCKENKIPIGPGRGSAAGALTLFVNGATKVVDPIKYDLLFFRFLTKDRVDPPDVDMDYSYYRRDDLINHLEEVHGGDAVCHIGTYTVMGVKSGLKDFGRVLDIPFNVMNAITKEIDVITEEVPGIKFKHLDGYLNDAEQEEADGNVEMATKLRNKYEQFKALEEQYPELFRLARKFEGTPRNMGVHASGILVMPCPVNDYFPTRLDSKTGVRVALLTGPQLESLGAIKLDILGLKTLDVLDKTLKAVDKDLTVDDLYEEIEQHLNDAEIFEQIRNKECEGLFQVESNLFKGLADSMNPEDIKDVCAMLAIGRPGPLSAGMHTAYAKRKSGEEEALAQLRGTDKITEDTYNTIIYQEQCMLISKLVAGFDDSQADSILRKALAKKKADKMELARRLFIYGKINSEPPADYDEENTNQPIYDPKGKYGKPVLGGINNGYTEAELTEFWEKLRGYASYLFNKSHSACYAVITLCTMYLKKKHTGKFLAALLSMQTVTEKIDLYSTVAKSYGINVTTPDANYSDYDFVENNNNILYGLKSIKGVGEASIEYILQNRPYASLEEAIEKVPKKYMNKRVLNGLIKAGAFDYENENRYELLNQMMDIRKDKDDRYDTSQYNKVVCMELENEVLGTSITYTPWFNTVENGDSFIQEFELVSTTIKKDRKGNDMAFVKLKIDGQDISGLVFSSVYKNNQVCFDKEVKTIKLKGKRSDDKIIIDDVVNYSQNPAVEGNGPSAIDEDGFVEIFSI